MIIRPQLKDFKVIGYYIGKIIIGLGLFQVIPLLTGIYCAEINSVLDFSISIFLALIAGFLLQTVCFTRRELNWLHGMAIVSVSWIVAMFFGAIPLYLSGHWGSFLDSCFDAMSGFATTGLTLVQDLDHMSYAHNMWRHLMMFIGGQGIVIVLLSFLVRAGTGIFSMYAGEAREERALPNVIQTARFIWFVSFTYLILGTSALTITGLMEGISFKSALFNGLWIFMAAFDTGGFAPHQQNILYYHSFAFEMVTIFIMCLGMINFSLHYLLWTGRRREIFKNIEIRSLVFTILVLFGFVIVGLERSGLYPEVFMLFRKGFYQLISAHTGTGYSTIQTTRFVGNWNVLSIAAVILAMGLGGSICSTTGGIKALRINLIFKGIVHDVKRLMLPENSLCVTKIHHLKDMVLEDRHIRFASTIAFLYIFFYLSGTFIGMFAGYPFLHSLFESVSATANVGLSSGITNISMPVLLKVTYIIQMWAGRLEFMSVFVLAGMLMATIRGKK